ncbi:hypothetical protein OAK75_02375 [Bacteriovoracales bacterium]|nr:hypothetical protein [Bacteriovoracales bacterium]
MIKSIVSLCLLSLFVSSCYLDEKASIKIPDAENQFFTKKGRLFVSGGKNIYEIKKDSSGKLYRSDPLLNFNCYATGITEKEGYLYATCNSLKKPLLARTIKANLCTFQKKNYIRCLKTLAAESYLLAAKLTAKPQFQLVQKLNSISFANGLTNDLSGNLYVADSISKTIYRVKISDLQIEEIIPWLEDLIFPNGIKIKNNVMYLTDFNLVKKVNIKNGLPGPTEVLYRSSDFLDDFSFFKKNILVTEIFSGTITIIREDGTNFKGPSLFIYPSSILQGRKPLFNDNQFIVTDKGFMYEFNSGIGNKLRVITLTN